MTQTTVLTNKVIRWLSAGVIGIAAAGSAAAGTFNISPIRIELSRTQTIGALTIHNDEDAPLMIQAQILAWTQENNEEKYIDSKDLLVTPPIVQLAPKSEQIVRVAVRHVDLANTELHYRLLLSEVPAAKTQINNGLSVALRMSVPIFITPAVKTHPDVQWNASRLKDGTLQIEAYNSGTAHLQITDFEIQFGDDDKVHVNPTRYVLPGSRIAWTVKPPAMDQSRGIIIHGYSDQGEFRTAIDHVQAE